MTTRQLLNLAINQDEVREAARRRRETDATLDYLARVAWANKQAEAE